MGDRQEQGGKVGLQWLVRQAGRCLHECRYICRWKDEVIRALGGMKEEAENRGGEP